MISNTTIGVRSMRLGSSACASHCAALPSCSSPLRRPALTAAHTKRCSRARRGALSVTAYNVEEEQLELFEAAEKRWQSQGGGGTVRSVAANEAVVLHKRGWVLLDVRPPHEIAKATVKGALCASLFVNDEEMSAVGLIKQSTAFGMGGWWLGGRHMVSNKKFMDEVEAQVPKDAKVIVCCQKGLRSLMACEQMVRRGFTEVAWLSGGFEAAAKADFECEEGKDVRLAGIGGLSEVFGWNEVQQRDMAPGEKGGVMKVIKVVAILTALDVMWVIATQLTPQ